MKTIDTITDIIAIVLAIIYVIAIIILLVINLKDSIKPGKYYKIEHTYDYNCVDTSIVKAKTPEQAIKKLIRKYQHNYPFNRLTSVICCKEVDFYKCLEEVSEDGYKSNKKKVE